MQIFAKREDSFLAGEVIFAGEVNFCSGDLFFLGVFIFAGRVNFRWAGEFLLAGFCFFWAAFLLGFF